MMIKIITRHMKNRYMKILILAIGMISSSLLTFADPPGPPGPGGPPGGGGGIPVGGPIEDGLAILIVLAIVYGIWKVYRLNRRKSEIAG
jgi:hypothetical protein